MLRRPDKASINRPRPFLNPRNKGFPKAIDLAKVVAATKDEAAFKTAMGELGNNGCTSCHEPFRRPKE
jgi:cytochrome c556